MVKEIVRIIIKSVCQGIVILVTSFLCLMIWAVIRTKFFLEDAPKRKIERERVNLIEFWQDLWRVVSIDCLKWSQLKLYSQLNRCYKKRKLVDLSNVKDDDMALEVLIKFAMKHDIPIIVSSTSRELYIENTFSRDLIRWVGIIVVNNDYNLHSLRGRKLNGVLFDASCDEKTRNRILDYYTDILPVKRYTGFKYVKHYKE